MLKIKHVIGLAAVGLAFATPAAAQSYAFGGSPDTPWTLTVNGTDYLSLDHGWINEFGEHDANNFNYFAGDFGAGNYNNWGVFDLSSFAGAVQSATLSLNAANVVGSPLYRLFDTNATLAALDQTRGTGDAAGIALHNDLGSGSFYGSRQFSAADSYNIVSISLNGTALSRIQSVAGGQFALGRTMSPNVAAAVPEPSTWLIMLFGFGMIGYGMRTAKRRSDEKFEIKIKNITYGIA